MAKKRTAHNRRLKREAKRLHAEFSDYENAVILVCSLEAWFEHQWGARGKYPGHLARFDRFPDVNGRTPDFLAEFTTPYVLCVEVMKNYRPGTDDKEQVLAYARWRPHARRAKYDVLVLVGTHSDDAAADDILVGTSQSQAGQESTAPVIVVGFFRDTDRVNGEWYDLKWRTHNGKNPRFSEPNACSPGDAKDLNDLIVAQTHCPIRVSKPAIDLAGRNPLINDEPPPIYTVARIVLPVINDLLTPDERDDLAAARPVKKVVSRADIVACLTFKPRERTVQKALDFLVDIGLAHKVPDSDPPSFCFTINTKLLKSDLLEYMPPKAARALVERMKARRRRSLGRGRDVPGQMEMFGSS